MTKTHFKLSYSILKHSLMPNILDSKHNRYHQKLLYFWEFTTDVTRDFWILYRDTTHNIKIQSHCHYLSCINKTTPENITRYLVLHTSYIKKTSDNTLKRFVLKTVQIISPDLLQWKKNCHDRQVSCIKKHIRHH